MTRKEYLAYIFAISFSLYLSFSYYILYLILNCTIQVGQITFWLWLPQNPESLSLILILVISSISAVILTVIRLRLIGAISIASWFIYTPVLFSIIIPMHIIFASILLVVYLAWYPIAKYIPNGRQIIDGLIVFSRPISYILQIAPIFLLVGLAIYIVSLCDLIYFTYKGEKLVKHGLYKFIRHPQYLGIILWTLGATILAERWFCYIAWATLAYTYILLAEYEEKVLETSLGEVYINYEKKTFFMIPLPIPRPRRTIRILSYTILYIIALGILLNAPELGIADIIFFK